MRYARDQMTADDITFEDLAPGILEVDSSIPEIPAFTKKTRDLDSIPVRVKTKYAGRGKRIVSAPTFDLVHSDDLSLFQQPRLSHIDYEAPRLTQNSRIDTTQRRSLPPLPKRTSTIQRHPSIRRSSMPLQTIKQSHQSKESMNSSYTNIIQLYESSIYDHPDNSIDENDHISILDPGLPTILDEYGPQSDSDTFSEVSSNSYLICSEGEQYSISTRSVSCPAETKQMPVYRSMVDEVLDDSRMNSDVSNSSLFSNSKSNDDAASSIYSSKDYLESDDSLTKIVKMISNLMDDEEDEKPPVPPKKNEYLFKNKYFKSKRISNPTIST